ncbi:MAG: large Ala/Glu-rich protein [Myxococcaceae bacterium]|nr:large Ala/Glu-rich protein [Myxococcaceae bacterium]
MTPSVSSRAHADLALAVYLEPHVEGRRVLLLGEAQGVLADRFDELASHLEIIDPAAREPSRGEVPELPFDDQSFDLVLVCDVATLPEPATGAVRELHRVLARGGVLALGSAALPSRRRARRDSPAHVALETLLAGEFRNVRILAQTALAGFAVGDLERQRGEEVTVDSSLMRESQREPERLLGLASTAPVVVEGRLWIEVPATEPAVAEQPAAPPRAFVEELRRAEDEAREALHRESDLLRKLEVERRARADAEQLVERARSFERKLLAAEADYDDAVARVRYFESAIAEHEAAARHDRERLHVGERELLQAKSELAAALERQKRGENERAIARAESEHAAAELAQLEQRLVELGRQVLTLEQDKKQHQQTARDLLEELRRLEHDKSAAVEHDARVAELEAERDRAVERSLEAEVARESAQMRADELRSELEERGIRQIAPAPRNDERDATIDVLRSDIDARELDLLRAGVESARQRGELQGLRLRLEEAELALSLSNQRAAAAPDDAPLQTHTELSELRLRLAHTEANLHALRDAGAAGPRDTTEPSAADRERARALETQLTQADQRLAELTRELEEADRFAELHAEDADRLVSVEAELEESRGRLDDLEDDVRALEEELRTARVVLSAQQDDLVRARQSLDTAAAEVTHRIEQAERREAERDDARAALAEARSILSQLASHVGADENDPPSIVQAVVAQRGSQDSQSERVIDELRNNLQGRDARIEQLERWLNEAKPSSSESAVDSKEN